MKKLLITIGLALAISSEAAMHNFQSFLQGNDKNRSRDAFVVR